MFKITGGSGFHITFENGWTVSVQFGPGTYTDNHDAIDLLADSGPRTVCAATGEKGSSTAECAVWGPDHKMREHGDWGDTVSNRSTPTEVLELLNWAAAQDAEKEKS